MSHSESVTDSDFASSSVAGSATEPDPGPMFPLVTTYVVFSIDPVTMVAALDDPNVTAVASSLHPKKYVGLVRNIASAHNTEAGFMAYRLALVRQGPTPKSSERFVELDMCIAVLPNTAQPMGRPPLQPTTPLPRLDCYHSSFETAIVSIPNQHVDATTAGKLPLEDVGRLIYPQVTDQLRQDALRRPPNSHHRVQSTGFYKTDSPGGRRAYGNRETHEAPGEALPEAHDSAGKNVHDLSGDETDDLDSAHDDIMAIMDDARPPDTMLLAVMTYDLSTTDAVSDPEDFYQECWVLKE